MKRKSLLFLLLFALIAPWAAQAQETLTVYDGSATNGNIPVYGFYADAYNKAEMIMPAADLEDMTNGTISKMTWYLSSPASAAWNGNFQVYLKEVDNATCTSTFLGVGDATLVWEGPLDGTGSTIELTFANNYTYTGGNLFIAVYQSATGTYKSASFAGEAVTNASVSAYSYSSLSAITSGTTRNFLPKTTFEYTSGAAVTCEKPTNLNVSYEGTTASATWDGEASLYNIDINGETQYGVTNTVPYEFTVEPNTTYTVKVQADCGGGDLSYWTTAVSFTTPCAAFALPYTYDFEDEGDLNCWTIIYSANTPGINTTYANSGTNSFRFSSYSSASSYDQYLISPEFNATTGMEVSFYYKPYSYGTEMFSVGYSTTTNETSAFTWVEDFVTTAGDDWTLVEESFPAGTKYVGIYYYSNYAYYLFVDDFTFDLPVTCPRPKNLVATNPTGHTVELSWTEAGSATAWQIMLNGDETNLIPAPTNPFVLTGLDPETHYTVQVRAYCDATDQSRWSDEVTFTTDVACPAPTALTVNPLTPTSATLNWEGGADQYVVQYRPVAHGTVLESIDFENSSMGNWTTIDADGDGYDWVLGTECDGVYLDGGNLGGTGHNSSADLVTSGSYTNIDLDGDGYGDVLYPDNFLVSPQVALGGTITFWACGQDASYASEVFGVAVSTTGNTDAADFNTISTWTMTSKGVGAPMRPGTTRSGNRAQGTWYQFTANLDAYAGQTGYVAIRHYNCSDNFMLDVDDIVIEGAASSEWTTATVNTNHLDITGLAEMTDYEWQVQAVCGGIDGSSLWASSTFTTPSMCDAPFDLNVPAETLSTTSAGLAWTGYQDGFEVWYRPLASGDVLESMDFNDTLVGLGNWTNIDADGDGYEWVMSNAVGGVYLVEGANLTGSGHESSVGFVTSGSYSNVTGVGALTPDNYLVSPQVQLGGAISFWACGQDASYAAEHFGVAVSTTSNTDASAFTTIWESTMTAKSVGAPTMYTRSGNRAQGTWYKYTVELEGYSGQGYVAIRHFGCTDQFMLNVDDIVITAPTENPWLQASTDASPITIEDLTPETTYEWKVRGENRDCGEEGYTEFSETSTFTTHGLCDNPNTLTWESTATTATLSWIGYQDSFDVTYYTAGLGNTAFEDDFLSEGTQIDDWVTVYDVENDSTSGFYCMNNDCTIAGYGFGNAGTVSYLISPEFDALEGAAIVEFYYLAGNEEYPEESFKIGYSTTTNDVESFTFGEEYTVTGQDWFDADLPEGTKYFAIQYTSTHTPDPQYADLYLLWFTVVDNYVAPGTPTTLEGVTSPVTVEGLEPTTVYYWEVQGINEDCGELDAVYSYFMTTYAQFINLAAGTTWFSTNLETTMADLQGALLKALPGAAARSIKIKSQRNGECTNMRNGVWTGNLKVLDVAQMYKITVPSDCEIMLSGWPVDPTEHPYTIVNGANWIGFPLQAQMSVTNAFANFSITKNDIVKAQAGGQAKWNNVIWVGALKNLEPGKGYIYNSVATEDKVLVFPTTTTKSSTAKPYMPKRDKVSLERTSFRKK